jgi:murein L,D-transpeptidase YafK
VGEGNPALESRAKINVPLRGKQISPMNMICAFLVLIMIFSGETSSVESPPETQEPANSVLQLPLTDPRIVILKGQRRLDLYSSTKLIRSYKVGLGLNPVPDKEREGDRATPEGDFFIFTKNPKSAFHLSLAISYPNIEDAERGLKTGLISRAQRDAIVRAIKRKQAPPQYTPLGGLIYIHGHGASSDWTWGCVALENADIEVLYRAIPVGTPVTIKP